METSINLATPTTFSYVLGGLKPLSVKLLETIFVEKRGFKNIDKKSKPPSL
jgi:hypothetical protein